MGHGHDFLPVPVVDLRLGDPTSAPTTNALGQVSALVRFHSLPLGALNSLVPEPADAGADLRARARVALAAPLAGHLQRDGLTLDDFDADPAAAAAAPCALRPTAASAVVSVVICTLGEDARLGGAVRSVLDQSHAPLELLVVDNDPASGRVPALLDGVTDARLRVLDEPRRGLSAARNTGVAAAGGTVVAFTDDDALPDPDWLARLIAPFDAHEDVVCTTGLVLPATLATPAQLWFEEFGAFGKGFEPTVWSVGEPAPGLTALARRGAGGALFPYSAGVYGSGNNMAFRLAWLREQALFDEALGTGTPTRGGEDLDAFLAVLLSGRALFYEPAALVRHYARSDLDGLRAQMFGYGSGMAAVITKHATRPRRVLQIAWRLPPGLVRLLHPGSGKNSLRSVAFPPELVRQELLGYAAGPLLYARARLRVRRRRR